MQARFFRAGLRADLTTDERKGKRRANGHTEQKRPPRGKMRGREIREEPARGSDAEELESRGADKAPRQQDPGHDPKWGHRSGRQALPRDPNGSSITGAKYSKLYLAADFAQNGEKCQEAGKRTHGAEKRNTEQSRGQNGGKFGNILQKHTCKSLLHIAADDQGQRDPGHADPIRAKCTCKSLLHKGGRYSKIYLESRNRSGTEPSGHALQSESILVRVYYAMQQSGKAWEQIRHPLPSVRKSCGGYMGASPGAEAERSETAAGSRETGKRNALQSKSLLVRVYYTKRQSITCYAYIYFIRQCNNIE